MESKNNVEMKKEQNLERKRKLLQMARRSRNRWVMDAAREDEGVKRDVSAAQAKRSELLLTSSGPVVDQVQTTAKKQSAGAPIPGQACIQTVLNFLSETANDAEFVNVDTLALALPDVEDDSEFDSSEDETRDSDSLGDEESDSSSSDGQKSKISGSPTAEEGEGGEGKDNNNNDDDDDDDDVAFAAAKRASRRKANKNRKRNQARKAVLSPTLDLANIYADECDATRVDGETIKVPQVGFVVFLKRLRVRDVDAIAVVKSTQSFVVRLQQEALKARATSLAGDAYARTADDRHARWANEIWNFLNMTVDGMRKAPYWAAEPDETFLQTSLFFEKFLFIKLYALLSGRPVHMNDKAAYIDGYTVDAEILREDARLSERMTDLDFLTPSHLDLHALMQREDMNWRKYFDEPIKYLQQISLHRAPVDIIRLLRNCTVAIASSLKLARPDVHAPGADELLPMMVLALQLAKPRGLHSCIQFIQRYTPRSRLDSEAGYLLTHLMSAVHFLEQVDESMLTISPREFEMSLQQCHASAQERVEKLKNGVDSPGSPPSSVRDSGDAGSFGVEKKQKSASAAWEVQSLTTQNGMFANDKEEDLFIEALASARSEKDTQKIWNKFRRTMHEEMK